MTAEDSEETATREAGKKEAMAREEADSATVGLREESDGATELGSDRALP